MRTVSNSFISFQHSGFQNEQNFNIEHDFQVYSYENAVFYFPYCMRYEKHYKKIFHSFILGESQE